MATNFDSSLFGGTALPADLQRQIDERQAMEFAKLSPTQQLGNLGFGAGRSLGKGLSSLFGVEYQSPEARQAGAIRQLSQGLDLKTADGLNQYADRLMSNGLPAQAAEIAQMARDVSKTEADIGLKKAQTVKAENYQQALADSTKKRATMSQVEADLAAGKPVDPVTLNDAKLSWSQELRPKQFQQSDGSFVTIPGIDSSLYPNLSKLLPTGGAGVKTANTIETPASREAAQVQAEAAQETVASVTNSMQNVKDALDLYNTSKTAGGYGQFLANLPNTDAKALSNYVSAIKSAFSVEEIAKLKSQSKTGATGFGSLAVKELETIQNAATALDPADKNFPKQLKIINDSFDRWKKLMEQRGARAEAKVGGGTAPTTSTNTNWQNPQGLEGQLAILNAELDKAKQQGNEADIAGLNREIARLTGKPATASTPSTGTQGGWSIKRK